MPGPRGEAFVDEIERGPEQERLVWPVMRSPLRHRRGADLEIVEGFDGGGGKHREEKRAGGTGGI